MRSQPPTGGQSEAVAHAYDQHAMRQLLCLFLGHHRESVRIRSLIGRSRKRWVAAMGEELRIVQRLFA
jgi:hypothetical protein